MKLKLAALVVIFFSLFSVAFADSASGKPATPIQISIVPESIVAKGQVAKFLISTSSEIASDAFVINIIPAKGSQWLSGPKQWRGSVLPRQAQQIHVTLRMPTSGVPTLSANAGIEAEDGSRMGASVVFSEPSASTTEQEKLKQGRVVPRQNDPVIEYLVQ